MILAVTMGLSLYRNVIGSKALGDPDAGCLSAELKAMFGRLIDGAARPERPVRRVHAKRAYQ
jgi:hypothetical protein